MGRTKSRPPKRDEEPGVGAEEVVEVGFGVGTTYGKID